MGATALCEGTEQSPWVWLHFFPFYLESLLTERLRI